MTAQFETRFRCNRCKAELNVPAQNVPDMMRKPDGWTIFWVEQSTMPAWHFCKDCSVDFQAFMARLPPPFPTVDPPDNVA